MRIPGSYRFECVVPLVVWLLSSVACDRTNVAACDGDATDAGPGDTVATDGAGDATRDKICNGTSEIRLALRIAGGGPAAPGTLMLSENGWRFLMVDGACTAWVLASDNDPLRSTTLGASEEQQLAAALRLMDWGAITPTNGGCADAPGATYRFGDQRLRGATCAVDAMSGWGKLNAAVGATIDGVAAQAAAWAGDVRYIVFRDDAPAGIDSRTPVAWPLAAPIEDIALTANEAASYRSGHSLLATGDDAARLRAIRTTTASSATTAGVIFDYTLVKDPAGNPYRLYIRDAAPQEQANGLLPPDTF